MLIHENTDFDRQVSKLILFDRDGTLNFDNGYTYQLAEIRLAPNIRKVGEAICRNNLGFAIVSNQSGIERGVYSFEESLVFTIEVAKNICPSLEHWVGFFCCPHLPEKNCDCRKPGSLMLEAAISLCDVDKNSAVFFGNTLSDEIAARNAGISFRLTGCDSVNEDFNDWLYS
jgi:D-glycero-D-manno-heptose 1,7-bisphosphate phosphatase